MVQGYDDNYYGDSSSYIKYPTDDKTYECRTGPFEGFFVSSVEFCKFKFDKDDQKDNSDNKSGTQGTPGPQGPLGLTGAIGATGPQGIQGRPGITQLNTTNLYFAEGNQTDTGNTPPSQATSIAQCDPGDAAISGG